MGRDAQWVFKNALFAVGEISLGYRTSLGWQVRLFAGAGRLVTGDLECLESCQGNSMKGAPEADKNMGFFGIELGHVF